MGIINGTDLMVFVASGSGSFKSVAYANSHSLSISADTTETSTKTKDNAAGNWNTSKIESFSWSLSSENLYCSDEEQNGSHLEDLFGAMKSGQPVKVVFGLKKETAKTVPASGWSPVDTDGSFVFQGEAYITSLELNAPDNENSSYTVEFTGTGELKHQKLAPVPVS